MKSFYLFIDSLEAGTREPADFVLNLEDKLPSNFNRVGIKSISLVHSIPNIEYICYVRTDLLNKDDNYYNCNQSDILAVFPIGLPIRKYVFHRFPNTYKNLKSSDFNSVRLTLSNQKNIIFYGKIEHVIYELEFVND